MTGDAGAASGRTAPQIAPLPRISVQAFCETQDFVAVMNAAAVDRRMDKAHVKVHMGGVAAAIEAFRGAPTPNLIVLESSATAASCSCSSTRSPKSAIRAPRSSSSAMRTTSRSIAS